MQVLPQSGSKTNQAYEVYSSSEGPSAEEKWIANLQEAVSDGTIRLSEYLRLLVQLLHRQATAFPLPEASPLDEEAAKAEAADDSSHSASNSPGLSENGSLVVPATALVQTVKAPKQVAK